MVETFWLVAATLLAGAGAFFGWRSLTNEEKRQPAFLWMAGAFCCQIGFLTVRGEMRGRCPLADLGEICLFLAWSMTLFYLVTGTTYRLSLLGVFSAPVIVLLQGVALLPGSLDRDVVRATGTDPWMESHAALSVLSYGALALAAVAGVMFFVLNRKLKARKLKGELLQSMPSIHRLVTAMGRITLVGWVILTAGIGAGFFLEGGTLSLHLMTATVTWVLYGVLLAVYFVRGMPGRQLAMSVLVLFLASLTVFAKL